MDEYEKIIVPAIPEWYIRKQKKDELEAAKFVYRPPDGGPSQPIRFIEYINDNDVSNE